MKRFAAGADRAQSTLLPECLDDFIDDSNAVRVIDAFVDALDLADLGFDSVEPAATRRPSYDPSGSLEAVHTATSTGCSRAGGARRVRNSRIGLQLRSTAPETSPLLDRCVSYMPNQGPVHAGQAASHYAVGARGGCRAVAVRRRPL